MIKNNRIFSITDFIDKNNEILLDIGTDHGYIIKNAFETNKTVKAIAADINEMPLASAKENLKGLNVEFKISDGFKQINEKFNTAVIAGLGSNLITEILEYAPKDDNITYILQGNNKVERLREYLVNNKFKIVDEMLVYENNRYYIILKVTRGLMKLTKEEIYLGPILKTKISSNNYYQYQLEHFNNLINKNETIKHVFKEEIDLLKKQLY